MPDFLDKSWIVDKAKDYVMSESSSFINDKIKKIAGKNWTESMKVRYLDVSYTIENDTSPFLEASAETEEFPLPQTPLMEAAPVTTDGYLEDTWKSFLKTLHGVLKFMSHINP